MNRKEVKMHEIKVIRIEKLFLNIRNYRIDFDRYNTLEKAVDKLYDEEDIIGTTLHILETTIGVDVIGYSTGIIDAEIQFLA